MEDDTSGITPPAPPLSDHAVNLDRLLTRDEGRRQMFIATLMKHNSDTQPAKEDIAQLVKHQSSVEHQLQEQVSYYETALSKLQTRTLEISKENEKLYERMNKSLLEDPDLSKEDKQKILPPQSTRLQEMLTKAESLEAAVVQNKSTEEFEDSLTASTAEPGQIKKDGITSTIFSKYPTWIGEEDDNEADSIRHKMAAMQRGSLEENDLQDTADISIASEPGQFMDRKSFHPSEENKPRKVKFQLPEQKGASNIERSDNPGSSNNEKSIKVPFKFLRGRNPNLEAPVTPVTPDTETISSSPSGVNRRNSSNVSISDDSLTSTPIMLEQHCNDLSGSCPIDNSRRKKDPVFVMNKKIYNSNEVSPASTNQMQNVIVLRENNIEELYEKEMKGIKDLYETKTKHLELLLRSSKKQIETQQAEIKNLKGELDIFHTPVKDGTHNVFCSCLTPTSISQTEKNLVQELLIEREDLLDAIKKQQAMVAEGGRFETEAYDQVKKSCELVEKANLEKQDAVVRMKQMEKEFHEQSERLKSLQKSHQDELSVANVKFRDENKDIIGDLEKKVEDQAARISGLENQLEKSVREKLALKGEIDKFELHSSAELIKTNDMVEKAQRDVMEALKRQMLAEHESEQLRLDVRFKEKRQQQEINKFNAEIKELKRRLDITEKNLNESQKCQLLLTTQINSWKQQVQDSKTQQESLTLVYEENKKKIKVEAARKEKHFVASIEEKEKQHEQAKQELTKMVESQCHIVAQYQNECKELSEKLCDEKKHSQVSISHLKEKCINLQGRLKEVFDVEEKRDNLLSNYKNHTDTVEKELKEKNEAVVLLMRKQDSILRERNLLLKQLELLKKQMN